MKLLIVTYEPYHDNSMVIGAYSSMEEIARAFPGIQFQEADGIYYRQIIKPMQDEWLLVTEVELNAAALEYE